MSSLAVRIVNTVVTILALALFAAPGPKPYLDSAIQVHRLSSAEAARGIPVQLRGIVTQVMPEWRGFSLQDETDALYVSAAGMQGPLPQIGRLIEVTGRAGAGNFAPIVNATNLRLLGTSALPNPRPADWKFISSGACDNDFIEVEGVVRSASIVDPPLWRWHAAALHVDIGGNLVWAYLRDQHGLSLQKLPDSTVRITGVCVVLSNSRRQFEQNVLLVSGDPGVQVIQAAASDPFSAPLTEINRLFEFRPASNLQHRVRVRGTVTLTEPVRIFLQHGDSGLMVRVHAAPSVHVGDVVDAVGFPVPGTYSTVMEDALIRDSGLHGRATPLDIVAGDVLARTRENRPALPDAVLVRMQGTVLDTSRSAQEQDVVLQDGDSVFTARLLLASGSSRLASIKPGSRVDVSGVCVIQVGDLGNPRSFELLVRSAADFKILKAPPWFTLSLALQLSGALLIVAGGAAIWVVLLRRRVRAQTQVIRRQIEREAALGKRFGDLVENASDMVYVRDLEGHLFHVNQGTERLTGYGRDELLSMNFVDLLVPEERERARRHIASSAAGKESEFELAEWRFLRKDGREITVEVSKRFIEDGAGHVRIESIGRDVTARKLALVENQERFRTLADNIAQLAWIADERGFVFWFNQRWFDYTGANLDESRGSGWQKWHHRDHLRRVLARLQQSFEDGEMWEDTFPLRSRDGEYRWFQGAAMPIRDREGHVVRWFGTYTDITEQKQIESALKISNQNLSQFAYVASHDLQEPLRNICIFAEVLRRSYTNEELTPERKEYLDILSGGAQRMEALIRDLLTYSRLTTTDTVDRRRIESQRIFEEALANLSSSIGESGATITHDALPAIEVSASQFYQVLQNLIGNSIKYRRDDTPLRIHLHAERQGDQWVFSVADNGRGFDPKYAENVFGIFKRLHGAEIPGTGIGLAICKTIIERHGGRIWAEARVSEGATFYFTIPDRTEA